MTFPWGYLLGFFTAGMLFSHRFRAGFRAIVMGLGRVFMEFRKWAITHGPYAEKKSKKIKAAK